MRNKPGAFDGFPLFIYNANGVTTQKLFLASPTVTHHRSGTYFGVGIPVNLVSLFKPSTIAALQCSLRRAHPTPVLPAGRSQAATPGFQGAARLSLKVSRLNERLVFLAFLVSPHFYLLMSSLASRRFRSGSRKGLLASGASLMAWVISFAAAGKSPLFESIRASAKWLTQEFGSFFGTCGNSSKARFAFPCLWNPRA